MNNKKPNTSSKKRGKWMIAIAVTIFALSLAWLFKRGILKLMEEDTIPDKIDVEEDDTTEETFKSNTKSVHQFGENIPNESTPNKSKLWQLLINNLPDEDHRGIVLDFEDLVENLKESGTPKVLIFLMVLKHWMPLLLALIRGRIPLMAKKKVE